MLVVHGEPGVGKTALLEYLAGRAAGCRVLRVAGVQSEMELAFAGVHQLCAPLLGRLGVVPGPQRQALRTAFGMSAGPPPDRFLVGLAVLGLLSEVAGEQPVLCMADDAQWLDRASAQVLAFVARRLGAESVGLVFGTRAAGGELAGLPELAVAGLAEADARALLDAVLPGPVDARVREQIIAETRGNPLALLELPRGLTPAELAGGFGLAGALPDPGRRVGRTLAAAQAHLQAGSFGKALELLATVEAGPLDELQAARTDWLRGQVAFASGMGGDAPPLLLKAARRLEPLDPGLARETYLDAWHAALYAGHLAVGGDLEEVSRAARSLPPLAHPPRPAALLLDGLALLVADGPAAAPVLRQATRAFAGPDVPVAERLRWGWMAPAAVVALWDREGYSLVERLVQLTRKVGALGQLPILLGIQALDALRRGEFAVAASLIAEAEMVGEATGARIPPDAVTRLAALRGRELEAAELIQATLEQAAAAGQGSTGTWAHIAAAILYNGLGRYADALAAARQASEQAHVTTSMWALPEMVEAAARTGDTGLAGEALGRLAEWTRAAGTDWALGTEAWCRALVSDGEQADGLYREAIARLGRTRMRPELARAHLLYGEWLRRQRRRTDAREQLRTAVQMLDAIGMEGFAERARRELRAAGVALRKRAVTTTVELTAQEAQIARLAADGLSNPEIGARLFLSPRTVQYHLGKVFSKLGITSRVQLSRALSGS